MPTAMRSSVFAFALCSWIGGAQAAGPATTWSDPPSRASEGASASEGNPRAAPAAKPSPPVASKSVPRAKPPSGMAPPRRTGDAAAHRPPAMARQVPVRPPFAVSAYPAYRGADFPPADEDARLERLGPAVHSGYLVMRRRTVEYPDGRVIRFYRPADEGDGD